MTRGNEIWYTIVFWHPEFKYYQPQPIRSLGWPPSRIPKWPPLKPWNMAHLSYKLDVVLKFGTIWYFDTLNLKTICIYKSDHLVGGHLEFQNGRHENHWKCIIWVLNDMSHWHLVYNCIFKSWTQILPTHSDLTTQWYTMEIMENT